MIDSSNILISSFATLLVVIAPGPGMLYVISRGLAGGRKAGVISALGISSGIAIHILAAAFGLSLIIVYGLSAAIIRKWMIEQPRVNKVIDWAMGSLFVFLGIRLALSGRQ